MTADLAVSCDGGAALHQVHALEYGVLSIPVLDGEGNVLQSALFFFSELPGFLFPFECCVIREHVQLLRRILRDFRFRNQIAGRDVHTANQQILMHHAVIYVQNGVHDGMGGAGAAIQIPGTMGGLGDFATIGIRHHGASIFSAALAFKAFAVVPDIQHDLLRDHVFPDQIQHQQLRHFPDDQPPLFKIIRALQDLPGRNAAGGRTVLPDVRYRHRLPAPCMVDDQLGVDAEGFIEPVLAIRVEGGARDVA